MARTQKSDKLLTLAQQRDLQAAVRNIGVQREKGEHAKTLYVTGYSSAGELVREIDRIMQALQSIKTAVEPPPGGKRGPQMARGALIDSRPISDMG